jgi:hypothetical protein
VATLVRQLPEGAAIFASLGSDAEWTTEAHLLANLYDAYLQSHSAEGKTPPKLPRPGDAARADASAAKLASEAQKWQDRQRERERARVVTDGD